MSGDDTGNQPLIGNSQQGDYGAVAEKKAEVSAFVERNANDMHWFVEAMKSDALKKKLYLAHQTIQSALGVSKHVLAAYKFATAVHFEASDQHSELGYIDNVVWMAVLYHCVVDYANGLIKHQGAIDVIHELNKQDDFRALVGDITVQLKALQPKWYHHLPLANLFVGQQFMGDGWKKHGLQFLTGLRSMINWVASGLAASFVLQYAAEDFGSIFNYEPESLDADWSSENFQTAFIAFMAVDIATQAFAKVFAIDHKPREDTKLIADKLNIPIQALEEAAGPQLERFRELATDSWVILRDIDTQLKTVIANSDGRLVLDDMRPENIEAVIEQLNSEREKLFEQKRNCQSGSDAKKEFAVKMNRVDKLITRCEEYSRNRREIGNITTELKTVFEKIQLKDVTVHRPDGP